MRYKSEIYKNLHDKIKTVVEQYLDGHTIGTKSATNIMTRSEYDEFFGNKSRTPMQAKKEFMKPKNFDSLLDDIKWADFHSFKDGDEYRRFVRKTLIDILDDLVASHSDTAKNERFSDVWTSTNQQLLTASYKGDINKVRELINKNSDIIETTDENLMTPLLYACQEGKYDIAELLLAKGANIEAENYEKATPLLIASRSGHNDIVELLLEKDANVNSKTSSNNTPLTSAMRNGNVVISKKLLERGADISIINSNKKICLDYYSYYHS